MLLVLLLGFTASALESDHPCSSAESAISAAAASAVSANSYHQSSSVISHQSSDISCQSSVLGCISFFFSLCCISFYQTCRLSLKTTLERMVTKLTKLTKLNKANKAKKNLTNSHCIDCPFFLHYVFSWRHQSSALEDDFCENERRKTKIRDEHVDTTR